MYLGFAFYVRVHKNLTCKCTWVSLFCTRRGGGGPLVFLPARWCVPRPVGVFPGSAVSGPKADGLNAIKLCMEIVPSIFRWPEAHPLQSSRGTSQRRRSFSAHKES